MSLPLLGAATVIAMLAMSGATVLADDLTIYGQFGDDWFLKRDGGGTTFDQALSVGLGHFALSDTYRMSTPDLLQTGAARRADHIPFSSQALAHLTWTSDLGSRVAYGGGLYSGAIGAMGGQAFQCWWHHEIAKACPSWGANPRTNSLLEGVEAWSEARLFQLGPKATLDATVQVALGNQAQLARVGLLFGFGSDTVARLPLPTLRGLTAPDLSDATGLGLLPFIEAGIDPALSGGKLPIAPRLVVPGVAAIGQLSRGKWTVRATAQISSPYYDRPGKPEGTFQLGVEFRY